MNGRMDKAEPKWIEVIFPEDATMEDFVEFLKFSATFSVDVNTKDIKVKDWIYKHKDWLKKGGE